MRNGERLFQENIRDKPVPAATGERRYLSPIWFLQRFGLHLEQFDDWRFLDSQNSIQGFDLFLDVAVNFGKAGSLHQ